MRDTPMHFFYKAARLALCLQPAVKLSTLAYCEYLHCDNGNQQNSQNVAHFWQPGDRDQS